ncbi:unnamed protein product [Acanthosepion pharaonis]|uniref:Peptidase A2 domain-containing protein n=1 Tax=Acanthosepion pharaonis TaxID=158019 RepID=A0A812CQF1_ACAPH|nr:unnamed protein product [Sepia pharaonis]
MSAAVAPFPPFHEGNIKNWFLQMEAIFTVRRITDQKTKFGHVVAVLPPAIVDEVSDFLEAVPEVEPYARLLLHQAVYLYCGRGKQNRQRVKATNLAGKAFSPKLSRLFYVTDTRNNLRFLVDTGAAISVLPVRDKARQQPFQLRLQAANGSSINTYGTKSLTLNIGMRRDFTWNFTVADVQMPILGADFLAHYDLAVRMNNHSLTDNLTRLCVLGTYSKLTTTGITVATCHNKEYLDLLNQYQDLMRPAGSIDSTKHQTQHFIKTTGQPVFSRPRRLAPNKLKFAKKAFDDMLREGVIRPSDSPYASPLHLVPKPGKEDYRICVDYRRLNSITVRDRYPIPHLHDFTSAVTTPPVSSSFIQDLRFKMANLCYTPPRHCPSDIYLPFQLKDCEYVFVRNDSVKRPLTPAYTGPYRVLKRADKYFQIQKGIHTDNVSIDRLKPAFIEKPSSHATSQSTPQVQENFKTPVSLDKPKCTSSGRRVTFPKKFETFYYY